MLGNYLTLIRRYSPLYVICLFTELISRRILFSAYNFIFKLMGVKHVIVTLFNGKKMILEVSDRGLSHDLLFDYKKHREPYASSFIINYLKENNSIDYHYSFIDVGCNLGYYSVLLNDQFKYVIGIEPVQSSFNISILNAELNGFINKFSIFRGAVAPKKGYVEIGNQVCKNLVKVGEVIEDDNDNDTCVAYTIEDLCNSVEIDKISFMKMDVEGYEYDILVKGEDVFSKYKPKLFFLEIHFDILGKDKSIAVLQMLERNGYYVKRAFSETKVKTNWLGPFSSIYEKFVYKFIMKDKYGELYADEHIKVILENEEIINAKHGAIEFIFETRGYRGVLVSPNNTKEEIE